MIRKNLKNIIIILFYLIFSITMANIPLFNYLGYEFSFITALITYLTAGIITIILHKNKSDQIQEGEPEFILTIKKSIKLNLKLLLIPFFVISINGFFVRNCSLLNGVLYFILLPVIGILFSILLSSFVCALFEKRKLLWFGIISVLLIINSFLTYYFYPQLFVYNPICGYFTGFVYDEELSISLTLILYRCSNLIEILLLFYAAATLDKYVKKGDKFFKKLSYLKRLPADYKYSTLFIMVFVVFWFFENELHIVSNEDFIQTELGGKYSTNHFEIFYSPRSYNDEEIKRIGGLHEFYFEEIQRDMKTDFKVKIKSYIYPSAEIKRDLIGAKYTDIAKPWLYQVHINSSSVDDALKHELVHVIAGDFGFPIIKAGLKVGLIEGLAMAIEWESGNRTLHQYSAQLLKMNMLIDMEKIMTTMGFAAENPSYGYIQSGSFCRFLIERYGIEKIKSVYSSGNFDKVYNKDISVLNLEWREYLRTIKTEDKDTTLIKYLFRRPSIFQKVCARVIANYNEKASIEMDKKNYNKSAELYRYSLNLSFNNEAQQGLILSYFQLSQYDSVLSLTERVFSRESMKDAFIPLRLHRGDAFWMKGVKEGKTEFIDSAVSNYKIISDVNLNENYNFAANCRMEILKDSGLYSSAIGYYVYKKDEFVKALIIKDILSGNSKFYIGRIILARALYIKGEYGESCKYLLDIPDPGLNDYFKYEKYRILGLCNFYLKKYKISLESFAESKKYQTNEATILMLQSWIDKCGFFEKYNY
jgi:hypothetical protein